ncbi:copper homeostasis protein CutC [[Mycoplasma] testudinis]|uniref:copper homeostasis protein CutC n=1 Tax=[Mycoplasma] testudinis TaxID=33924 RepID=UPI00055A13AC|nr:copper homeostasis protein CutC [[Mycoplasma] testudinis]
MAIILEAAVNNLRQALAAQAKGANRIELCTNLAEGGTTPSYGSIKKAKQLLKIPMIVMIRVHGNNEFIFTPEEIAAMIENIKICKQLKVAGVAISCLTPDKKVDIKTVKKLLKHCEGLETHFLMGFDQIENKFEAIDQLAKLGINRILTKGGIKPNAVDNMDSLKEIVAYAKNKIDIVIGGKVTKDNYKLIKEKTKATQFHGREIVGPIGE